MIRPDQDGLIFHTLYYADEARSFDDIGRVSPPKLSEKEIEMGVQLIEQESNDNLQLEKYKDEHRLRVLKLVDAKVKRQEVEVPPPPKARGQVVDLKEALKQSLGQRPAAIEAKPQAENAPKHRGRHLRKLLALPISRRLLLL